jgi:ketosteroid isomerase-like protein
MNSSIDRAQIEALQQGLVRAHTEHDADAIVEAYAADAVVYSLAPPLGRRGMNRDGVANWLASWDGPIRLDAHDAELLVDGGLAFVSALHRMRGRQAGQEHDLWYRSTLCLRKSEGRWLIVCDHASVPFYMDGSLRAAVDLRP